MRQLFVQGFLNAPERTRTSTGLAAHKALNLGRAVKMHPSVSESAKLPGSVDRMDALDAMDVATGVVTGDRRRRGYDQHVTSAEIVEQIRVRISRAAPPDSRVILFGSRARGEADEDQHAG